MTSRSNITSLLAGAVLGGIAIGTLATAPTKVERIEAKYGLPGPCVERVGYLMSFDPASKTPRFTVHHLDAAKVSARGQRASFRQDESLPAECRATLKDYESGGALFDAGHYCPAGDQDWSAAAARDAGLLSNVAPQNARLNRGQWLVLENYIRSIAKRPSTQVWVVTGTLDAPHPLPQPGKPIAGAAIVQWCGRVRVPTHWFKAILIDAGPIELRAWCAPNGPYEVASIDDWRVSVDQLESLCNFDLWSGLPDDVEAKLEARR